MKKIKESISLFFLVFIYFLLSTRYFPEDMIKTLTESFLEVISVAPIPMGGTLIIVSFLQKQSGEKMPWNKSLRIYLTLGIMVEFLIGIYHYLNGV